MFDPMEVIVNSTGALVYVIDLNTYEILYANNRCIEEFGNVTGQTCYKVLQYKQSEPCRFCPLHLSREETTSYPIGTTFEWENQNSLNHRHYMFVDRIIEWKDGCKAKVQIGIDITHQKKLESEVLKEQINAVSTFEMLIDSTLEGLIIYDEDKRCIRVNGVAPTLLGYSADEMIGIHALDFIAPSSHDLVKKVISNRNQEPYEAQMLRKDGTTFPAILRGKDIVLADKKIRVSAVLDITEMKNKEQEIIQLAHYDSLTKLPNRLFLKELLNQILKQISRTAKYAALLFIDLDHFKVINDTQGHDIGDAVLIETAQRIKNILRQMDVLARLGGDEFVVAIELDEENHSIALEKITSLSKKILTEIEKPYIHNHLEFNITTSIGIIIFNDTSYSIEELMKFADSAMYNAKENGRNNYHFFDPQLQQMLELKTLLLGRLRKAIEQQHFILYYQPQIFFRNNQQIIGVEALIRWNDPEYGMISPGNFIPLAEESGLIVPLGEWIIHEAMRQIKCWENDKEKKMWRISVNVSYKQFEKDSFINMLISKMNAFNINPSKLRLELTESLLFKNTSTALEKLEKIKSLGFALSIDDFGTGYSSLSYLKQLPINELKIDQSFIRDLSNDPNDFIIVETILSIGRKFNLEVIAEGVETQEQFDMLLSMGCTLFQGYFFGKPMNVDSL